MLSPSEQRIAYYDQCPVIEHCIPAVVILDLEGHRISSFHPQMSAVPPHEPCASILSIEWASDNAIAAECHINPSLSEYIETDLTTGQIKRDLLGYDFARSPDGAHVAHVGWIIHFAPPFAQSNYLQIENTTIYPLPQNTKPVEQKGLEEPPQVVHKNGLTYSGIHEFMPRLSWSPDSRRIALVDCTYDWTANSDEALVAAEGTFSNYACSIAVVSGTGEFTLLPLTDVPHTDLYKSRLSWLDARTLQLEIPHTTKVFTVP